MLALVRQVLVDVEQIRAVWYILVDAITISSGQHLEVNHVYKYKHQLYRMNIP
jgi:hypothetical protein